MRGAVLSGIVLLTSPSFAAAQSDPAALRKVFDEATKDLPATMKNAAALDPENPWGAHFVAAALREARRQTEALETLAAMSGTARSAESAALRATIEAERYRPDRSRDAWREAASSSAAADMRSWCESNARFHAETCERLDDARKRRLLGTVVAVALFFGALMVSRRL